VSSVVDFDDFIPLEPEQRPEQYTATVTLTTTTFADLGPVLDAIEAVVRVAPYVTGKVEAEKYSRVFYGWDIRQELLGD
jgi:hypothetical protein